MIKRMLISICLFLLIVPFFTTSEAEIKKNVNQQKRIFYCMIYSTTPPGGKTGLTVPVSIKKGGETSWSFLGNAIEEGHGFYSLIMSASHTDTDVIIYSYGPAAYPGYDVDYPSETQRMMGLLKENTCVDSQVYSTIFFKTCMTRARLRTYSDAASVCTDANVVDVYDIVATYDDKGRLAGYGMSRR